MKQILLIATLLLFSCWTNKFEETLQTFVGKDYNSIIEYWGHPDDINEAPNGNDILHYHRLKDADSNIGDSREPDGTDDEKYCDVYFEVGKDLKILKFSYRGNYCWEE